MKWGVGNPPAKENRKRLSERVLGVCAMHLAMKWGRGAYLLHSKYKAPHCSFSLSQTGLLVTLGKRPSICGGLQFQTLLSTVTNDITPSDYIMLWEEAYFYELLLHSSVVLLYQAYPQPDAAASASEEQQRQRFCQMLRVYEQ